MLYEEDDEDLDGDPSQPPAPIIKTAKLRLEQDSECPQNGEVDRASLIQATNQQDADADSGSKGSGRGYYEGPPRVKYWWNHPKIRQNYKVMIAAFLLCFIGLGLFIGGIVTYAIPGLSGLQGAVFLIAGVICFVPGAYHIGYIYLAIKGMRGFELNHLPLFNS